MTRVYVFGNEDFEGDKTAILAAKKLEKEIKDIEFVYINPNEDLPFENEKRVVILDAVEGLDDITTIKEKDFGKLILAPRSTVHDYDLGFQLKYLKKLGKLGEVIIVGLPMGKDIDYVRIQSILRKLVAQDMQGS